MKIGMLVSYTMYVYYEIEIHNIFYVFIPNKVNILFTDVISVIYN